MSRKTIDCQAMLADASCTILISAADESELREAAIQHAVGTHEREDDPQLRQMIRGEIRDQQDASMGTRRSEFAGRS